MRSYLFGRYAWLAIFIRDHRNVRLTDIDAAWRGNKMLNPQGDPLPMRTFHRHRAAIHDVFGIDIECDTSTDTYRIAETSDGDARDMLLDAYASLFSAREKELEGRIIFEDAPKGRQWLTVFTEAMRIRKVLKVTYFDLSEDIPLQTYIEPYCVKAHKGRWYAVARNQMRGNVCTYDLSQIGNIEATDEDYYMDKDFDPKSYFSDCYGIEVTTDSAQKVVICSFGSATTLLRHHKFHPSQVELRRDDSDWTRGRTRFELHLRITQELVRGLLPYGDKIQVLEPQLLMDRMSAVAHKMAKIYDLPQEQPADVNP